MADSITVRSHVARPFFPPAACRTFTASVFGTRTANVCELLVPSGPPILRGMLHYTAWVLQLKGKIAFTRGRRYVDAMARKNKAQTKALGHARLAPLPPERPYTPSTLGDDIEQVPTPAPRTKAACKPVRGSIQVCNVGPVPKGPAIGSAGDICNLEVIRNLAKADREHFVALHLNVRNKVIASEVVSVGSLYGVEVRPSEVFKSALVNNAAKIAFVHNHPSGDVDPSRQDMELTTRLRQAGGLLGIEVLDHIITSPREACMSFAERGYLGSAPRPDYPKPHGKGSK